eukprot:TRINITY_DN30549_c0_g1_i1.p1 TRINITY_DN30549_c0_g1~~TRINITY_DN30549_c0_g1_i1.p1  ORF type:complete len:433 (+),score=134.40 TRINITY_DN30549_c0_g1_i1:49-1299(+)
MPTTAMERPTQPAAELPVPAAVSAADEAAPTLAELVKLEFLDELLERFPRFNEFYHRHPRKLRTAMRDDWREMYREHPEYDYSGKTKAIREWIEKCREAGLFNGGVLKGRPQFPSRFAVGQRVRCRDAGEQWRTGVVKQLDPIRVRPDGDEAMGNWKDAHWDEIEPLPFQLGDRVRCRDSGGGWMVGRVKAFDPLRVRVDHMDGAHVWSDVEALPDVSLFDEETLSEPYTCPISLRRLDAGESVVALHCGCKFLRASLEEWFQRTPSCPLCRSDLCVDASKANLKGRVPEVGTLVRISLPTAAVDGKAGHVLGYTGGKVTVEVPEHGAVVVSPRNIATPGRPPSPSATSHHSVMSLASTLVGPPTGSTVRIVGLSGSSAALNGTEGTVLGYTADRIAVKLPSGKKAFRPQNCEAVG